MRRSIYLTESQHERLSYAEKLDHSLTPMERNIVKFAICGHPDKVIASQVGKSPKAVGKHIENITNKGRLIFGNKASFRNLIVPELSRYYFLAESEETTGS